MKVDGNHRHLQHVKPIKALPSLRRTKTSRPSLSDYHRSVNLFRPCYSSFKLLFNCWLQSDRAHINNKNLERTPSASNLMSAAKLVNKFRRASTFILADGTTRDDDGDRAMAQCSNSTSSTAQKRPALLRSRAAIHERVTGSLKLAKQKCSSASNALAPRRYVKRMILP